MYQWFGSVGRDGMHLTITWPVECLKVTRVQYGQTAALLGCEPGLGLKGIGSLVLGPGY